MDKKTLLTCSLALYCAYSSAQEVTWPKISIEAKPAARWWWLGSAVDDKNLTYNIGEYSRAGMGTMEITPIYGVKGNDANDIEFLSPAWMKMLRHTEAEAKNNGMQIDMNTGTGWPFGGPEVSIEDAACKVIFEEYKLGIGEKLNVQVQPSDQEPDGLSVDLK